MTASELRKRYKPSKALDLSIEKWERLGFSENWKKICKNRFRYLGCYSCGLCKKYNGECYECPLDSCDNTGHPWDKADIAVIDNNRPAFMKARKNLLRRMKRAKARGEK
jgi:hypothetical protein